MSNPKPVPAPALLTLEETATIARAPLASVRHWIATDRLPSVRPGRRRLVRRADLARFLGLDLSELG
jgi:excisionase family DNA binding protein